MAHWGLYRAAVADGDVSAVHPFPGDRNPSVVLGNVPGSVRHRSRITDPCVRRGWLEDRPGATTRRGADEFVTLSWPELTEILGGELRRVIDRFGNEAIYGGSYGWASAGRFHHAQSQIHRFLNCLGGFTRSVNSYSLGATGVIMPHVLGAHWKMFSRSTSWPVIARHTDLFVAFGGVPIKNTSVNHGGTSDHPTEAALAALRARGGRIVSISPLRDDIDGVATWLAPRPGSDVAVMLALAYVLATEKLHDTAFLDAYCTGYDTFERYLLGDTDGIAKTPAWASDKSGLEPDVIVELARSMASRRTLVAVTWSLQRTRGGEQAPWMGVTLAAMLGQIGIAGGGFGHGYGSMNEPGTSPVPYPLPTLPQGINPVATFIPVAAVSDMLLHPGKVIDYNGSRLTYPDIKLVHWAGGNPFHHHQDLGRLRRALGRPDTVVVHDPYWTAMAKHADIVVPSTTSLERNDLSCTRNDPLLVAMQQAVPRAYNAQDDYDTFAALARTLGVEHDFTQGRTSGEWIEHLYGQWRSHLRAADVDTVDFAEFWRTGSVAMATEEDLTFLADYREDPVGNALRTPSGRIEIFSEVVDGFGYEDCGGHPAWYEPDEWLKGARAEQFPLHLIANQPRARLHSQLDHGAASQASKIRGREPVRMHPDAAAARGVGDGDVVKVYNDRGSCLAGVLLDDGMRSDVVQLSTGAWYDPLDPADTGSMCKHGNPNVLTADVGTSTLSHGCTGQHVLVEIERYDGDVPPITAFDPPRFVPAGSVRKRFG